MSGTEVPRKPMALSLEAQFFNLTKQLRENTTDEQRENIIKSLSFMRNLQLSVKGVAQLRQECNDHFCALMLTLIQQQNELWSSIWIFVVQQLGQDLHSDNKFLNNILSILEQGMKRKDSPSLTWSFKCWKVLIDNFALSSKMISASRRVSLLTIPLKAKNIKDLDILDQKLKLWWHLMVSVKEYIDIHSEIISKPFLQFTFGPFEHGSSYVLNKFPRAAKTALSILTGFIATGIADQELIKTSSTFKSTRPLINESKAFLCVAEWTIKSIDVLLKQPEELPVDELEILLSATLTRIVGLCKENSTFGGDMLALFLKMLKETLFGLVVLKKMYKELLLYAVESCLKILPQTLMDTKLKNIEHVSPRDFMFKLLCDKEHLLMHAKPSIQKTDERQCVILGRLLESSGALVAQPDRLANAMLLVDTLTEIQDMSQGEAAKKCFHLWEQSCRFLCKIPKESPNEQCNQIGQKIFTHLILMPFRLILNTGTADLLSSAVAENAVVKTLKNLFFLYSEIVYLSLSIKSPGSKKDDPCRKIYQNITNLLTTDKYSPSTCQTLVKVISKFIVVRSSINYTKLFGKNIGTAAEMAELKLLAKLTSLLVALSPDSPVIAGKISSYVAKALENLVLLVTSTEAIIEAIKIFFELLTETPLQYWPNNRMEVTDPWDSLVSPFKRIWSADKEELNKNMPLLLEIKPKIEILAKHLDIKVCNSAREMLGRYNKHDNDDSSNSLDNTLKSPTSTRLLTSRKRSFLMTQSPPVSQVSSPSHKSSPKPPSLEDLDSQDFVKIPSQPKMKKPLTPHQREVKRRRREDIPALYQGLSQDTQMSQDTLDESPVMDIPKLPLNVPTSVWSEDAMDIDLASTLTDESDENKSLNSQEEPVLITVEDDDQELKKEKETQDIEIVENSQNYATVPLVREPTPDVELLQVSRARNRQGVLMPTVKAAKEAELPVPKVIASVNKRKSLPPVRGAGLKGRAAQMVGLAANKDSSAEQECKQVEVSAPAKVMSSLMAMCESKSEDPVNANDMSPLKNDTLNVSVTPISSHRKRSNLKKDAETPSPRRSKRVSFAEPIVTGEQDSPNILQDIQVYNNYYKQSPNTKKKASRKLLMAPKDGLLLIQEHVGLDKQLNEASSSSLIEPSLTQCSVPVSDIVDKLVSQNYIPELVCQLVERNIETVQDLNKIPESAIADLTISEPKLTTVKSVLKLFVELENKKSESSESVIDKTTEIESLPVTQPDTLPIIVTATTHADTIPVIEDVDSPPDEVSPSDQQDSSVKSSGNIEETQEQLLSQNRESPINKEMCPPEEAQCTQNIVESSLEPDMLSEQISENQVIEENEAVEIIEDTQVEAALEPELDVLPTLPTKTEERVLSAEEKFAALSFSEKQKLRKMILEESESQELIDTLQARNENMLSSMSISELLGEIKYRSCAPADFSILKGDPGFLAYAETNISLPQLMQKNSVENIATALRTLSEQNEHKFVESMNKTIGSLESTQLKDIFFNHENKICDSLPTSTIENRAKALIESNSVVANSLLCSYGSSSVVDNLINRCSGGLVSFTHSQAGTLYSHIKKQVTNEDSSEEILDKLDHKMKEGSLSQEQLLARAALKKRMLTCLNQEELYSRLEVTSQEQRALLSTKLSQEDLLSMTSEKLLTQKHLSKNMIEYLEKLSLHLPSNSILSLLKSKALDEESKKKAVALLTKQMELAKLLEYVPEQQLMSLLDSLLATEDLRLQIALKIKNSLKNGEMVNLLGKDKLIDLMTLGVLNGDIDANEAIPKIFCNSDIVGAACQIFKDGASDAQVEMIKAALPKQVLAMWITEIIMK